MSSTDQALVALARSQHAVFTGRQAVERGVTRKVLRGRLASGWLTQIDHDVFHVAGTSVTWEAKVLAAQLAAGPGTVASHRTAAALWGLEGFARGTPEVTVPRGVRFRRVGVRVHSSTDLRLAGRRIRSGIEVTDPARTVLDLARRLGDDRLLEAIESARRQRLTSWSELLATLAKHARRGRPGIRRLRRVIAANIQQDEVTDSNLEVLMLVLLREHGLPEPVLHHRLHDPDGRLIAEVDLAFPRLRVAIELDGAVHRERAVFERDRPRQNAIVLQGWTLLRFTWRDVVDRPEEVVAAVRSAIALAERRR